VQILDSEALQPDGRKEASLDNDNGCFTGTLENFWSSHVPDKARPAIIRELHFWGSKPSY
jgi:hypothetical protein